MDSESDMPRAHAVTNLFTNYMQLGPLSTASDPRPWLRLGAQAAPLEQMSVFLHELTHHWCFLTPVNFTIAHLTGRARLSAWQSENSQSVAHSPFVDMAAAYAIMHLLRPINEGLALFAEFDMATRVESSIQSAMIDGLLNCFMAPHEWALLENIPEEYCISFASSELLWKLRASDATVDKKASLLLKPLDPRQSPYLLGYLSVKSLWRTASRCVARFMTEADLFMMYLRSYIFEDAGMICALLEPCDSVEEITARVANRLAYRIQDLENITCDDVKEFESSVESPAERNSPRPGIRISPELGARSKELLDEQHNFWVREVNNDNDGPDKRIATWLANALSQRQFATLISSDVHLESDSQTQAVTISYEGQAVLGFGPKCFIGKPLSLTGVARLDVILSMETFFKAAVVSCKDVPVAVIPLWFDDSKSTVPLIKRWYTNQRNLADIEAAFRKIDSFFTAPHSPTQESIAQVQNSVLPFWTDVAFRYARDYDAIDRCSDLMATSGFRGLGMKSSLVKQLALISLAASRRVDIVHLQEVFANRGWDLNNSLAELAALYEKYGFPPQIPVIEGTFYSTI
jgi:hypothetical protein